MKLENSVPALGKVSDRGEKVCNNQSQGISNSKKENYFHWCFMHDIVCVDIDNNLMTVLS